MTDFPEPSGPEPVLSEDSAICNLQSAIEPPWGFRDLGLIVLCAVTALFLAQSCGLGLLVLIRGHLPDLRRLLEDVRFLLPVQFAAYALTVAFIYFLVAGKYRQPFWQAIRWRSVGPRWILFLMMGVALAFASQLIPLLFPSPRPLPIEKLFTGPVAGYLLAMFGILIAPFVEELFFRGMVYPVLERRWGLEPAVFVTAAFFSAIHAPQLGQSWPQVLAIFLVGAVFSYVRGRTGTLLAPYLMHLSYNTTLFVALYLSSGGFTRFS